MLRLKRVEDVRLARLGLARLEASRARLEGLKKGCTPRVSRRSQKLVVREEAALTKISYSE